MSFESLNQFFQEISQNPSQQQELVQSAIDGESLMNKVVELGKEKGYNFTITEVEEQFESITKLQSQSGVSGELSEEELESVAGGFFWTPFIMLGAEVVAAAVGFGLGVSTKDNCFNNQIGDGQ